MPANTSLVDVKSPSTSRRDLPALTGIRFIAALLVFFGHVVDPRHLGNTKLAEPFRDHGVTAVLATISTPATHMAMSCFFILSGFVISWSTKPGERMTSFWRRRVVKIFPSHAVTWALAMVLFASAFTANYGVMNLFFLNTWFTERSFWGGANGPAWSLNAEMLFYLLFPLLLIPIKRIAENRLWLWAGGTVLLYACACIFTVLVIPETPSYGELSVLHYWFVYYFPPMRLFEFVLGMIVARIVMSGRWPRIPFSAVGGLLVGSYALTFVVPFVYRLVLVSMVPLALVLGTLASANLRGRRTVLGTGPMIWLGKVSFGFYLTQTVVIFALRPAVFGEAEFGPVGAILLVFGLLAANVVCGWLLHIGVERPAMKHWSRSKKRAADNATTEDPDKARAL